MPLLNIPARYCNGYLGDIGVPPDPAPMDFNAWFEVYLGNRWYTFDARHNQPRIGRILIARGRDAADIPMITTFGSHRLTRFTVVTEEIQEPYPSRPDRRTRTRKRKLLMMTILLIILIIVLLGGAAVTMPTAGMAGWIGRRARLGAGGPDRALAHGRFNGHGGTGSELRKQVPSAAY